MTVVHPVSFESNDVVTTPEVISTENITGENVVEARPSRPARPSASWACPSRW